jgi:hypothetical protein
VASRHEQACGRTSLIGRDRLQVGEENVAKALRLLELIARLKLAPIDLRLVRVKSGVAIGPA